MPCTRSMRSKTSKKKDDVMPPPEPSPPPKPRTARTARTKKEEKKPKKVEEDVPVPVSPTASASSTRSTRSKKGRGKGKAKAQPAEVVVVDLPSSPEVPKATRSAKPKTATSKTSKSTKSKKGAVKVTSSSKEITETGAKTGTARDNEEEFNVPAVPKPKGRAGRPKRAAPVIESTSEDISDVEEEMNVAQSTGKMTFEHMKNSFVAPIKTVFQSLDVCLDKILGQSVEHQERQFEALLAEATSMPPPPRPPLPAPKGKGRAKRGRSKSPEKTKSKTDVPKSFNFAQNVTESANVPAQKKMLLDVPSSDEETQAVNASDSGSSKEETNSASAALPETEDSPIRKNDSSLSEAPKTQDPNSTYVFPQEDSKKESTQALNVTVCLTKSVTDDSSPTNNMGANTPPKTDDVKTITLALEDSPAPVQTPIPDQKINAAKEIESVGSNDEISLKEAVDSVSLLEDSSSALANVELTPKVPDPNATYVLPQDSKKEPVKRELNVTVCVKKDEKGDSSPQGTLGTSPALGTGNFVSSVPILPIQPQATSSLLFSQDLSRTFVKEPPLASVVEEEEGACSTKSEKGRPPVVKPMDANKKGLSSSSSASSNTSMKSATSQPCLSTSSKKLVPGPSGKNGPVHGSTSKLNEVQKSKAIEEAERRKQEIIRQRQENSKKQMEEWKKKTEKIKLEEEKKKQKIIQQASSNLIKKPNPPAGPTPSLNPVSSMAKGPVFAKPKLHFGPATVNKIAPFGAVPNLPSSLPKHGFPPKPAVSVVPESETDLDDSFKTASPPNSFMETTVDIGHLSSYDITVYEDLDEDLRHRENKTIPTWASDKEALKVALFSMVLLPEYQYSLPDCFPRPDKSYKLFPNKNFPM